MTSQSVSAAAMKSRLLVVVILIASLIAVPQLTGSDRIAGLIGSVAAASVAAVYARRQQSIIGPRWMWLSLAITAMWLAGLAVLAFVPLPPGGATAT